MKRILCLLSVSVITCSAMAQEQTDKKMDRKMDKMEKMDHGMKDCVMMKDGKVVVMKGGKTMTMTKDMTTKEGMTIMKDGSVKMKDGSTVMLKEGEMLTMDGKVMDMDKKMMPVKP